MDQVDYGVCGCSMCGVGIYDGVIVWVMKDGTKVNAFRGNWRLEQRIDEFIANELTMDQ